MSRSTAVALILAAAFGAGPASAQQDCDFYELRKGNLGVSPSLACLGKTVQSLAIELERRDDAAFAKERALNAEIEELRARLDKLEKALRERPAPTPAPTPSPTSSGEPPSLPTPPVKAAAQTPVAAKPAPPNLEPGLWASVYLSHGGDLPTRAGQLSVGKVRDDGDAPFAWGVAAREVAVRQSIYSAKLNGGVTGVLWQGYLDVTASGSYVLSFRLVESDGPENCLTRAEVDGRQVAAWKGAPYARRDMMQNYEGVLAEGMNPFKLWLVCSWDETPMTRPDAGLAVSWKGPTDIGLALVPAERFWRPRY